MISQIKDKSNGKIINTIKDNLGRIIYEAWKLITKSGIPPLSLLKCKGDDLEDYKIYGNSIQDGTPTPEAPVEIESVGDKSKNLFDYVYFFANKAEGGGTSSASNDAIVYTLKPNTNYIVSTNYPQKEDLAVFFTKSGTYTPPYTSENGIWAGKTRIVTTDSNGKMFIACRNSKSSVPAPLLEEFSSGGYWIQIEEGSVPTSFEPYGYKIPVKTRKKNFFAIDGFATTSTLLVTKINNTSFTLTAKKDGTYRQSGTKFLIRVADLKNNFLTVKAENVIKTSKGTPLFVIRQYDKNMQLLAQLKNCQLITSGVKVSLSNLNPETAWLGGILCLSNENETTGSYCTITDLQIYDGADNSIITNIYLDEPLRKIGDYSDYIDFENQKVVRNIKERIFDGTENWKKHQFGTNCYYIYDNDLLINKDIETINSNYFKGVSYTNRTISENNIVFIDINYKSINFRNTEHNDINSFINFLKKNSVKVNCILSTPIEENIELPNIPTLEDVTVLQVNTKIQPSNMEVKYKGLD